MLRKDERLKYRKFTAEEKIRCMDAIIRYCKDNARVISDKYDTRDLKTACEVMGGTKLFDFIADHVVE